MFNCNWIGLNISDLYWIGLNWIHVRVDTIAFTRIFEIQLDWNLNWTGNPKLFVCWRLVKEK